MGRMLCKWPYSTSRLIASGSMWPYWQVQRCSSLHSVCIRCVRGLLNRGGLVGNVAGLWAALQYRGVPLIHVPTTLLAMSDSVLSLKQAVNTGQGKNHIGTFYKPQFIW